MKIAKQILDNIDEMKPLDKVMKDVEKSLQDQLKNHEEIKKKKIKVLGKGKENTPAWELTDDQLKKIYSKEQIKSMQSTIDRVRRKKEMDKQRAASPQKKTQKGTPRPVEDRLLSGGALGVRGAKKTELKPGVFKYENPRGKFRMTAIVDTNKKTVEFKGQTDDMLFVKQNAERLGFKFKGM